MMVINNNILFIMSKNEHNNYIFQYIFIAMKGNDMTCITYSWNSLNCLEVYCSMTSRHH